MKFFLLPESFKIGLSVFKLNKYLNPKKPINEIRIKTSPSSIVVKLSNKKINIPLKIIPKL